MKSVVFDKQLVGKVKNKLALLTFVVLIAVAYQLASARANELKICDSPSREVQFVCPWSVEDSDREPIALKVTIFREDRKPVSIGSMMQIRQEDKIIYSFDPGLYPVSVFDAGRRESGRSLVTC
jgi:hypothetical protein